MSNLLVLFNNNLFEYKLLIKSLKSISINSNDVDILILEHNVFYGHQKYLIKFNKLRLIYNYATIRNYYDYLQKNKNISKFSNIFFAELKINATKNIITFHINELNKRSKQDKHGIYEHIIFFDPTDKILEKEIMGIKNHIIINTPLFLLTQKEMNNYYKLHKDVNQRQNVYNKYVMKRINLVKFKKSYDKQNRNAIPHSNKIETAIIKSNDVILDIIDKNNKNKYVKDGIKWVNKFSNLRNLTTLKGQDNEYILIAAINRDDTKKLFKNFLKNKLSNFGKYQDAIVNNQELNIEEGLLFHSVLSPMMNMGLITPLEIIKETKKYYTKANTNINIADYEGFLRQIMGWREYMRYIYEYFPKIENDNYFKLDRTLSDVFYYGKTSILPVDETIKYAFKYGYLNHIDRLMIILNFMVLCELNPIHIYKWFMEFSLDSYPWVMLGNIYGMGYFTDTVMTKNYLSSSNYILKMSNNRYKSSNNSNDNKVKMNDNKVKVNNKYYTWEDIWDGLYWRFIEKHQRKLMEGSLKYYYTKKISLLKNKKTEILLGSKYLSEYI